MMERVNITPFIARRRCFALIRAGFACCHANLVACAGWLAPAAPRSRDGGAAMKSMADCRV